MATRKMSDWPAFEIVNQYKSAVEIFAAHGDPAIKDFRDRCHAEIVRRMEGAK